MATTVAYVGNRTGRSGIEPAIGFAASTRSSSCSTRSACGISLTCLAISHYVLGFTSALADNIAANVGLVIADVPLRGLPHLRSGRS